MYLHIAPPGFASHRPIPSRNGKDVASGVAGQATPQQSVETQNGVAVVGLMVISVLLVNRTLLPLLHRCEQLHCHHPKTQNLDLKSYSRAHTHTGHQKCLLIDL